MLESNTEENNQKAAQLIGESIGIGLLPIEKTMAAFNESQRASLKEAEKESDELVTCVKGTLIGTSLLGLLIILTTGMVKTSSENAQQAQNISKISQGSAEKGENQLSL